jgi:hypothetical protein
VGADLTRTMLGAHVSAIGPFFSDALSHALSHDVVPPASFASEHQISSQGAVPPGRGSNMVTTARVAAMHRRTSRRATETATIGLHQLLPAASPSKIKILVYVYSILFQFDFFLKSFNKFSRLCLNLYHKKIACRGRGWDWEPKPPKTASVPPIRPTNRLCRTPYWGTVGDALSYQVGVYFVISSIKFCVSSITPLTKCRHTDSMACLHKVCASNTNRDMKKPWHIYEAVFTTSIVCGGNG